jgi:hypothetical protein
VFRSDTVRARIAVGLFERISEWNGYGRSLLPFAAGVSVSAGAQTSISTTAALMAQVLVLGIGFRWVVINP